MKKSLLSLSVMALLSTLVISCGQKDNPDNPTDKPSEVISNNDSSSLVEDTELPFNYVLTAKDISIKIDDEELKCTNGELQFAIQDGKVTCQGNAVVTVPDDYPMTVALGMILKDDVLYVRANGNLNLPEEQETAYLKIPVKIAANAFLLDNIELTVDEVLAIYNQYAEKITKLLSETIAPLFGKVVEKTSESLNAFFDLDFSSLFTVKENANSFDYALSYTGLLELSTDLATLNVDEFLDKYLGENVYATLKEFAPTALDLTVTDLIEGAETYCGLDVYELLDAADEVLALASEIMGQTTPLTVMGLLKIDADSYEDFLGEEGMGPMTIKDLAGLEESKVTSINNTIAAVCETLEAAPAYALLGDLVDAEAEDIAEKVAEVIAELAKGTKVGYTTNKAGQLLSAEFSTNGLYGAKGTLKLENGKDFTSNYAYASVISDVDAFISKLSLTRENLNDVLSYQSGSDTYTPSYDENGMLDGYVYVYDNSGYTRTSIYDLSEFGYAISPACSGYYSVDLVCCRSTKWSDQERTEYSMNSVDFYYNPTEDAYADDMYHEWDRTRDIENYTCGDVVTYTETCETCHKTYTYTKTITHDPYNTSGMAYGDFGVNIYYCYNCGEVYDATIVAYDDSEQISFDGTTYVFFNETTGLYTIFEIEEDCIMGYYDCSTADKDTFYKKYKTYVRERSSSIYNDFVAQRDPD